MPSKRRAGPVVFEDTDLLQTIVWSEALLGAAPPGLVQQLEIHSLPQLYLLLGPEMGWVDDGTRYHAEPVTRTWFFNRLLHWLERIGADWTIIAETAWDQRRQRATQAVRERLSQGPDHSFRRKKTVPQSA
ncbi:AAA family ATPase [Roseibium salinum]|nr:AAA family ATPase [Roseibium salinum]